MESIKQLKEICQPHRQKEHPRDFGYLKHRELSIYITWAILRFGGGKVKPNHVSVFNIFFGLILLCLVALIQDKACFLLFLFLLYFSFLLDKVDGEVARYSKLNTLRGAYLDEVYHLFVQNGLILAVALNHDLVYFGLAGFFFLFLSRYLRKARYFIYVKYKPERDSIVIRENLSGVEKLLIKLLNFFPLKLCSVARRHDILLFTVFFLSLLYFETSAVWFWFLFLWSVMLAVDVFRFLYLNYLHIDRDVQLIDQNQL